VGWSRVVQRGTGGERVMSLLFFCPWGVWKDNRRTSRDLLHCRFNIATCSAAYVSTPQTFAQS